MGEIGICHTARIIDDALPKVFTGKRQERIIQSDGTDSIVTLNDRVMDDDSGQPVELNNLSKGLYHASCSAGVAFQNRQQETVNSFLEISQIDPSILQIGKDIFLKSLDAPGFDKIADRVRQQMLQQGIIPADQMTDEEKQQAAMQQQQQQGEQQQDPMMVAAQAELGKAQAAQTDADTKSRQVDINLIKANSENEDKIAKNELKMAELIQKNEQLTLERDTQMMDAMAAITQEIKTQAETLKILAEATGADAILTPALAQSIDNQAKIVVDSQRSQ